MSFTQQTNQGVVFHTADAFSAAGGIAHGFATRIGGVSKPPFDQLNLGMTRRDDPQDVLENYRRFCAALGTDVDHLVMTHQVHQDTILEAKPEHVLEALLEPIGYDTDGLMTDIPGLCLTIYYADCIPVLLYDPVKRAIAAVHSGWRGTSLGIAPQAVQKLAARYGSDPHGHRPRHLPLLLRDPRRCAHGHGRAAGRGRAALLPAFAQRQVFCGSEGHPPLGTDPGGGAG